MHASQTLRPKSKPARITSWARLWLACIAALIVTAAHLLPPALQRRLPLLDLPPRMLARFVARLVLMCALEHASVRKNARALQSLRMAGALKAILRTGVRRHLTGADGAYSLHQIWRTCANPEAAIASMTRALERGLTRRTPLPQRAACVLVRVQAPTLPAHACDSS